MFCQICKVKHFVTLKNIIRKKPYHILKCLYTHYASVLHSEIYLLGDWIDTTPTQFIFPKAIYFQFLFFRL